MTYGGGGKTTSGLLLQRTGCFSQSGWGFFGLPCTGTTLLFDTVSVTSKQSTIFFLPFLRRTIMVGTPGKGGSKRALVREEEAGGERENW